MTTRPDKKVSKRRIWCLIVSKIKNTERFFFCLLFSSFPRPVRVYAIVLSVVAVAQVL